MSAEEADVKAAEEVPKEEAAEAEATANGEGAAAEAAEPEKEESNKRPREPVQLGYKLFDNGGDAANYFSGILHGFSSGQDLNEYEHKAVLELLEKGHPEPDKKKGCGVKAFQLLSHSEGSLCYNVIREDGSREDFSYLKCLKSLFPDDQTLQANKPSRGHHPRGGHRGGGGGGRGRGGRGRGGRGRGGRGRGRGR